MKDIPHNCGKVLDYCIVSDDYRIVYCIFCKKIKGYEKNGKQYIVEYNQPLSDKILQDNV